MWAASAAPAPAASARSATISLKAAIRPNGPTQKARPQCLRPHPRGVRGEAEGVNCRDEGGDRGSAAAERHGRR